MTYWTRRQKKKHRWQGENEEREKHERLGKRRPKADDMLCSAAALPPIGFGKLLNHKHHLATRMSWRPKRRRVGATINHALSSPDDMHQGMNPGF